MNPSTQTITSADSWLRMSLALGFVIGLIFISAWLLKKMSKGGFWENQANSGQIQVLTRTPLGDKRYLMVVAIAEKTLLLGVTPQNITLLSELDGFEIKDQPKERRFERLFRSAGKRMDGDQT